MHDHDPHPIALGDALRALPLPQPAANGWLQLHAELQRRRRQRRVRWTVALAASLLIALMPMLPTTQAPEPEAIADATPAAPPAAPDPLQALIAESTQLEALLALTADDPLQPAEVAALNSAYVDRLQWIDTVLGSAEPSTSEQLALWRERVLLLRRMAGIESSQQMLAAQGDSAAALVATF